VLNKLCLEPFRSGNVIHFELGETQTRAVQDLNGANKISLLRSMPVLGNIFPTF
jgi:hypothetical protein